MCPMPLKHLEESSTLNAEALEYIHGATSADITKSGAWAPRKLPAFDDLVFLISWLARYPLEGYREDARPGQLLKRVTPGQSNSQSR